LHHRPQNGLMQIPVGLKTHPELRDVLSKRARRSAVSAVMPRLPKTISFIGGQAGTG